MDADSSISEAMLRVSANTRDLPEEWSWRRLEEVCAGIYDCPHSTPKLTTTGPYVVRTQDILSGVFLAASAGHVSEETYRERVTRAEPKRGDLLYSREGTYFGIAAEVPPSVRVCLGQRMVLIRPDRSVVGFRFLRYWLNSPIMATYIHGFRDGSVAERLNLPTIRSLPVLVPPMSEQSGIADVLGALDDKIAVNDRIVGLASELISTLFVQALERPGSTAPPLGDVIAFDFGLPFSSDSFNSDEQGLPLLRIRDIKTFAPQVWTTERIARDVVVQPGDVVAGMDAEFRPAFWLGESVLLNQRVLRGRPLAEEGGRSFVREVLRKPLSELEGHKTGTTVIHLNKRDLDLSFAEVPEPSALAEFEAAAEPLRYRIVAAAEESRSLIQLRDALLPRLMSGEIRVRDAEKAVEDVT